MPPENKESFASIEALRIVGENAGRIRLAQHTEVVHVLKWRAQGDDLRTFLRQFASEVSKIDVPSGLSW
jgi:hypothetical protein